MSLSEDLSGIGMRLRLVLPGEVQIDIRLLVSVKAEEGLKGDVEAPAVQLRAAVRALFLWHVTARHSGEGLYLRGVEVTPVAVRADIVRRKRVYLCDMRHCRGKGGADGTPGTDEIAVLIGLVDEPLRNDV